MANMTNKISGVGRGRSRGIGTVREVREELGGEFLKFAIENEDTKRADAYPVDERQGIFEHCVGHFDAALTLGVFCPRLCTHPAHQPHQETSAGFVALVK